MNSVRKKKHPFSPDLKIWFVLFFTLSAPAQVYSTEPFSLEDLTASLSSGTPATEEFQYRSEATSSRVSLARSRYFPELGLEGGYESYRWTGENLSSPFGYGYARWNLFNGFRDRLALKQATFESHSAEFEASLTRRLVLASAIAKFYEALFFQELIEIKSDALSVNSKQQEMAKRKRIAGITSLSDETEFSLRRRILESDILAARSELARSLRELDVISGGGNHYEAKVPTGNFILPEASSAEESQALEQDPSKHANVVQASYAAEISALSPAITSGNWLPKVDFEATYGRSAYEFRQLSGANQASFLLKLNFPLFNGFGIVSAQKEATALRAAAEKRLEQARLQTASDLPNVISKLKSLRARLVLEDENLNASGKYYDLTLREYQRGVKNSPDLAGASDRMIEARTKKLELLREFLQTWTLFKAKI